MDIRPADLGAAGRRQNTPRLGETDSRRRYLLGALLALSSTLAAGWTRRSRHNVSPAWLRQFFPRLAPAATIGRRYLDEWVDEASRTWLVDRLFGAHVTDTLRTGLPAAIRRHLRERRLADFRSGDLVFVDGWVLSRTEARLMALVALFETS